MDIAGRAGGRFRSPFRSETSTFNVAAAQLGRANGKARVPHGHAYSSSTPATPITCGRRLRRRSQDPVDGRGGQDAAATRQLAAIRRAIEADAPMVMDLHDWPLSRLHVAGCHQCPERPSIGYLFCCSVSVTSFSYPIPNRPDRIPGILGDRETGRVTHGINEVDP